MPQTKKKSTGRPRGRPPQYLGKWNQVTKSYALEKKNEKLKFSGFKLRERQNRTTRGIKKDRSQKNQRLLDPSKRADLLKIMYLPDVFRKYDVKGIDDKRTKASAAATKKKLKKARSALKKAKYVPPKKLSYAAVAKKKPKTIQKKQAVHGPVRKSSRVRKPRVRFGF